MCVRRPDRQSTKPPQAATLGVQIGGTLNVRGRHLTPNGLAPRARLREAFSNSGGHDSSGAERKLW
jgi:hypothetical protein